MRDKTQKKIGKHIRTERLVWADIIRIIAIYFVVQSHTLYFSPKSSDLVLIVNFVLLNIEKICVPLFVMLSGAMLLKKDEGLIPFFKKRVLKVVIPWIVWTGVYMWYKLTYSPHRDSFVAEFFHTPQDPLVQWIHFFVHTFLTVLWFLPIITALYLLTPLMKIVIKHITPLFAAILILVWFVFVSLYPFMHIGSVPFTYELTIRTVTQYIGYYVLGYYVTLRSYPRVIFYLLPLPIVIGLFPQMLSLFSIKRHFVEAFSASYVAPGIIIASVASFVLLFSLLSSSPIKNAVGSKTQWLIQAVSKASLGIYITHWLVIDQLGYMIFPLLANSIGIILYPLVIFTICACIVISIQQIPLLRRTLP